jgi:coenzyme F420-0:L-glutamate ligase/coenzyme F420-1:gamma-L-glutamate ligase
LRARGDLTRARGRGPARPGRAGRRRGGPLRAAALGGIPEIVPGDDLGAILAASAERAGIVPGDVLVVAHKVVSKSEGRIVELAGVAPGPAARALAEETGKDPALCELILAESRRIVRRRGGTLIVETHHGFVCANAGIDSSNVSSGRVVLLPRDPDASARRLQVPLARTAGGRVGVVVCDTHGRAFRRGLVNVAIGVAGFEPVADLRGGRDREGRLLVATEQAVADELAAASGLLMPKDGGTPAVLFSGVATVPAPGSAGALVRAPEHDLFRGPSPT